MESIKKTFQFGDQEVTLETGEIARQAGGAVMVTMGDTVVLVTAVAAKEAREGQDFFPLTVNYQEKFYASGTIPGSFFRREGRPSERETLISRLIDRPIRPLFPKGFKNEVQVIATVKSVDSSVADTEIPAMIGTSAALAISGVPFNGPIGAAQVGYINGEYVLNPNTAQKEQSDLELSVAGTDSAVLMVESEASVLSEEIMLGAVLFGHEHMQPVIEAIKALKAEVGKPAWDWQAPEEDTVLNDAVSNAGATKVDAAYQIADKMDRYASMDAARDEIVAAVASEDGYSEDDVKAAVSKLEKKTVRSRIIAGNPRIDGRDNDTVRPIFVRTGVLPRAHGSALFTRGETQALVVTTLGTERDAQLIDSLEGSTKDPFMLQYNFPPFSVGECGRTGSPGRREIGHGKLAKRGVMAVLPSQAEFPYTMRVVSEITESNGSSSMASVCGSSLAMMDAGVPLKAPVAGIAMGLIKEGNDFAVLTDILGDEDHLGDMDFKVAGTDAGITALQMDIKIEGITREIMEIALTQAKEARLFILEEMNKVIATGREDLSQHAPRYVTFKINPDKIRDVIGKGGATIRSIQESTGVTIDISDDGTIKLAATDQSVSDKAKAMIDEIVADVEVDRIYEGKVSKIMDFGAFVTILPGKDGLVHISQISEARVEDVNDHLKEGQMIKVKVLEIDRQGRIRLSMKEV